MAKPEIWLIRHGETEWSLSGAHTSRTDLPLTAEGEKRAAQVGKFLNGRSFALGINKPDGARPGNVPDRGIRGSRAD